MEQCYAQNHYRSIIAGDMTRWSYHKAGEVPNRFLKSCTAVKVDLLKELHAAQMLKEEEKLCQIVCLFMEHALPDSNMREDDRKIVCTYYHSLYGSLWMFCEYQIFAKVQVPKADAAIEDFLEALPASDCTIL